MKKIRLVFTVILYFFTYSILYSQEIPDFIEIPDIIDWMPVHQSTQGGAMGRTSIAYARDASIVFSNPGGIAFLNDYSISAAYYPSCNNISYFAFSYNPKNNNYVCLNHQRYNETYGKKYEGYGIAFSKKMSNIGIGINIKMYQFYRLPTSSPLLPNLSDQEAYTFDLGALYYKDFRYKDLPAIGSFSGGMSLSNIFGQTIDSRTRIELPYFLRTGYSLSVKSIKQKKGLSIISFAHSFEYAKTINSAYYSSTGAGIELAFYEIIYGRIGYYRRNSIIKGSTSGFGLSLPFNRFFKNIPIILQYNYGRFLYEYYPYEYIKTHSVTISYKLHK